MIPRVRARAREDWQVFAAGTLIGRRLVAVLVHEAAQTLGDAAAFLRKQLTARSGSTQRAYAACDCQVCRIAEISSAILTLSPTSTFPEPSAWLNFMSNSLR